MNISRENGKRVFAVSVFIQGRDMGSVVKDMQAATARKVKLPAGYYLTWGGEFENQQRAMKRLAFIVPISIFLIFVLLFDAFKSVRSALLILLNVPFALIGGIVALFLTGIPLSVSAAMATAGSPRWKRPVARSAVRRNTSALNSAAPITRHGAKGGGSISAPRTASSRPGAPAS